MKHNSTFLSMTRHCNRLFMALCLLLLANTKASAQQTLYAISGYEASNATLYKLDPSTGAVVATIGNTGLSNVSNMTVDPLTGNIYVQASRIVDSQLVAGQMQYAWQGFLYLVDSLTAVPLEVETTSDPSYDPLAPVYIIYSPAGVRYTIDLACHCVVDQIGVSFDQICHLYFKDEFYLSDVDTNTGNLISFAAVNGFVHNMFAVDINNNFYSGERLPGAFSLKTIDPISGLVSAIGQSPVSNMAAIAFGPYRPQILNGNNVSFCVGGSVNLMSPAGDTYQWKLNGNDITGANAQSYTATQSGTYSVVVEIGCGTYASAPVSVTVNPLPVLATSVSNVTCFGAANGSINLSVTGAAVASYSWNNGATTEDIGNLSPGTYSVNVTDVNNCSASTSAPVSQPATALSLASGGQTTSSATVIASGGTPPYSYNWLPSGGTNATATGLTAGVYTVTVTDANNCAENQSFEIESGCNISFTANVTNVACHGQNNGAIDVTITSGPGSYTYSWSNGSSSQDLVNRPAGTYTLTVSSNGCSVSQSYTITQPNPLNISGITADVSCYNAQNGAINVNVSGGTPPYTYTWADVNSNNLLLWVFYFYGQWCNGNNNNWPGSNIHTQSRTGLDNGCYYVKVTDANGCSSIASFTIHQPSPICVTYSKNNSNCSGTSGSINQNVYGGTSPYTYQWSNGATTQDIAGIGAGTYSVTITDANGCTENRSYSISQSNSNININYTKCNAVCNSNTGSINISVSGGSHPYTYQWSNGATTQDISNIPSGNYTVLVTDANGCTKTQTIAVSQSTGNINVSYNKCNAICTSATGSINISVSGGAHPYTYQWSNGATTQDIYNLTSGNYTVVITDANGCTKTQTYNISQSSSNINVSYTKVNAGCSSNNGSINISVSGGAYPYSYQWSNGATTQDVSGLAAGNYTVVITDANGCTETRTYSISQSSGSLNVNINVSPTYPVPGQQPYTIYLGYGAQCVTLSASISGGSGPYTRQWSCTNSTSSSISVSPSQTMVYTLTVTDQNGCTATAMRTIFVKDVRANHNKIYVCHHGNTMAVPQSQVDNHLCHGDDLGTCSSGGYCRTAGGDDGNGGEGEEEPVLAQLANAVDFNVYPNPTTGSFTVAIPTTGDVDVVITDVAGKVIEKRSIKANTEQHLKFSLEAAPKGVYLVKVSVDGELYQSKVTIQ